MEEAAAEPPPNILVILTDDQPVDSLQVMPATRRWFRQRGTEFPHAYVTTPYCCPSRASILTGQYTHNHDVRRGMQRNPNALGDHTQTVEYQLRTHAGYKTAFFGKYLNGWDLRKDPPHLDSWAIFPNSAPHGYYGAEWNVDGRRRVIDTYSTTYLRRRANRFVRAHQDEPWLMYVSTAAPHRPFTPEPKYEDAPVGGWRRWKARNPSVDEPDVSDKHPFLAERQQPLRRARQVRREMLRTMMSVDDLVASVMRTLRETGQRRDTLAIYLSDNGYLWGEHGVLGKMIPYTRSIKVPMLMRWPAGGVEEGRKDRRLVANIDLAATIYQAAGIEADAPQTDGRSLIDDSWTRDRLHFEFWASHNRPTWASTLTRDYQYVEWYEDKEGTQVGFREYYDLAEDPHQLHNRMRDPEGRAALDAAALSTQLQADRNCAGPSCP